MRLSLFRLALEVVVGHLGEQLIDLAVHHRRMERLEAAAFGLLNSNILAVLAWSASLNAYSAKHQRGFPIVEI